MSNDDILSRVKNMEHNKRQPVKRERQPLSIESRYFRDSDQLDADVDLTEKVTGIKAVKFHDIDYNNMGVDDVLAGVNNLYHNIGGNDHLNQMHGYLDMRNSFIGEDHDLDHDEFTAYDAAPEIRASHRPHVPKPILPVPEPVELVDRSGTCTFDGGKFGIKGVIDLYEVEGGELEIKTHVDITGLAPGYVHGFHVHEFGNTEDGTCDGFGAHYFTNGIEEDIPPLRVPFSGVASYEHHDDNLTLFGEQSLFGRGMVIHDPATNQRIACCTIAMSASHADADHDHDHDHGHDDDHHHEPMVGGMSEPRPLTNEDANLIFSLRREIEHGFQPMPIHVFEPELVRTQVVAGKMYEFLIGTEHGYMEVKVMSHLPHRHMRPEIMDVNWL